MEKKECKAIIILCFVSLLIAVPPLIAAEIYMWVDEKGVKHITDQPPTKPAKMIEKESYRRDSPEEIKRYELQRKLEQQTANQETERQQKINQANEAGENMKDRFKARLKEYEKERNEKIRRDIDDLNARKERLQRNENDASSEYWRQYWKNEQRESDREVRDKQKILDKSNK